MSIPASVMTMIRERMIATGSPVFYCLAGHGFVEADTVDGDTHGACPGPLIGMEPNPDAQPEVIEGGVQREAPPCGRCANSTKVRTEDTAEGRRLLLAPLETEEGGELSVTLSDGTSEMTVCIRCLARALADLNLTLLAVDGAKPWWRS